MKNLFCTTICFIMTLTFFGLLYPEYVLLTDTYEYIENGTYQEKDSIRDFYRILDSDGKDVTAKSYFAEILKEQFDKTDDDMEGKQTCQQKESKQSEKVHR
ncbi:MAG: hypothetical protein PUB13_06625 [Lachnospiraceae bacterium]|nr:hypothetical protein [Lachnospiraceae bacterium]